jgi:hypothetical protein
MGAAFATVSVDGGVGVTAAEVNDFRLSELRFPNGYAQAPFEPELPYLAVVLEGALVKSFSRRTIDLGRCSAIAMPAGATHGARFSSEGARILVVRPRNERNPIAGCFDRPSSSVGASSPGLHGGLRASCARATPPHRSPPRASRSSCSR